MIVFGCNDVGPANYLAELVKEFNESIVIPSDLNKHIFKNYIFKTLEEGLKLNPKVIITGTSNSKFTKNIDKQLINYANENSIKCISVIEHWSWYKKRFQLDDKLLLPNYILVNDQTAYIDALKDGLPQNKLKILGNPYLEKISQNSIIYKDIEKVKKKYNLPKNKRIIFFISEELKKSFPENSSHYLGYDEFKVLETIKNNHLKSSDHLVVKLHPEEDEKKYQYLLDYNISVLNLCPLKDIVNLADTVIGMASMLLLEIAIYRNDVISFRPKPLKNFIGQKLGVINDITDEHGLSNALKFGVTASKSFRTNFLGSKKRIIKFINEIIL